MDGEAVVDGGDGEVQEPGEDEEFAGDVLAVQVVARVRFGVAERAGFADDAGPGLGLWARGWGGGEGVEEVGHGAAEDAGDVGDLGGWVLVYLVVRLEEEEMQMGMDG